MQSRRNFLRGTGTLVALPMLESFFLPVLSTSLAAAETAAPPAKRLVSIGTYLGLHAPAIYPKTPGA